MADYPNTDSASDVWSLRDVYKAEAGGDWPVVGASDPNFASVSLLINADGEADGSTNIVDRSSNSQSITVTGTSEIDTTTFKYGTGSFTTNTGGDGNLQVAQDSAFAFGTDDFTIEFWYKSNGPVDSDGQYRRVLDTGGNNPEGALQLIIDTTGGSLYSAEQGAIFFWDGDSQIPQSGTGTATNVSDNVWHHCAFVRNGTSLIQFVDGTQETVRTISASASFNQTGSTYPLTIGSSSTDTTSARAVANIDDFRITKGVARYTASFTPPTEAFLTQ